MVNNIKSSLILKTIFNFMNESSKLKIVLYNKKIQNILKIDFIDYKRHSGKKIIFDENGIGSEYDCSSGQLIFKGKYFFKEKRKIGLEFKDDKISFTGEIRNGKKWEGEGSEYDSYGRLIYDGQYLSGKRDGIGKIIEYNEFDNKVFECESLNGLSNGNGKEYDFRGEIIFIGEYLNGKRNGEGKEYNDGKLIYEGEYLNGKRNGNGKEYSKKGNVIFEGKYKENRRWEGSVFKYNNNKLIF